MSKQAVVISCFDYHSYRMVYWENALKALGYNTTYVTSDFHHGSKQTYECHVPDSKQLHVMPYKKNLSIERILSHRMFAKQVYAELEQNPPAVIVASIPPNFLVKYLAKYKRRHPNTKLILDIYDLWPETFPSSTLKKLLTPVFRIWGGLRDNFIEAADFVTSECGLFLERMRRKPARSQVLHFSLPPHPETDEAPPLPADRAEIAYLGSINNIIDIPTITAVLKELNTILPTSLHIIGDGESREAFCQSVKDAGVTVHFHGKVFDEKEKHRILSACHFGLNIMKSSVCVGLTMKSVDYLRHGLPLISNIPADTLQMITDYQAGVHVEDPIRAAEAVATAIRNRSITKEQALHLYQTKLTSDIIQSICNDVLHQVLSKGDTQ